MLHSYKFADAEHTVVMRDDGASIVVPPGESIANVPGRLAEDFRFDSCLVGIAPYTPEPVAPKTRLK